MSWLLLCALALALCAALLATWSRRTELERMARGVADRRASREVAGESLLQQPVVDLSRCLGCATCVAVCPEEVLGLVHGQAAVIRGERCAGVAACERECPVGAITVRIANLETRTDVPAVTGELEAVGNPGLFLAGEVTAHALIRTAVEHGAAVAAAVARRLGPGPRAGDALDLVVVGAGPAGLACALEAKRLGLSFVVLEQEPDLGGTVARYPRRKLVLTQPVRLPLGALLDRAEYSKEELVELWRAIARREALPIRCGDAYKRLERDARGRHVVWSGSGAWTARAVCLAIGRRGVPRRLGVPGEGLGKVAYSLLDARSYRGRRALVVGGGDAAVEAALALAEQPGNEVVVSYRRERFFRLRARTADRLSRALSEGRLRVLHGTRVVSIAEGEVTLAGEPSSGAVQRLANDDVFVMAGGVPPVELLSVAGVSFDPSLREAPAPPVEQGSGLRRALAIALALTLAALAFAALHADYYGLPADARPTHASHDRLRPGRGLGLALGLAATALVALNLLYLARRAPRSRLPGSLRAWMTSHVATGVLAFLCATLHAAMAPRHTVGGQAWLALAVLLATGAVGRYFYAWVPRAANGRELELDEVRAELERAGSRWRSAGARGGERVRALLERIDARQWGSGFAARALALVGFDRELSRAIAALEAEGRRAGEPPERVAELSGLARRAQRAALAAAHYEDLRAVLSTWRWLHRWVAALMLILLAAHVASALLYGSFDLGAGREP